MCCILYIATVNINQAILSLFHHAFEPMFKLAFNLNPISYQGVARAVFQPSHFQNKRLIKNGLYSYIWKEMIDMKYHVRHSQYLDFYSSLKIKIYLNESNFKNV